MKKVIPGETKVIDGVDTVIPDRTVEADINNVEVEKGDIVRFSYGIPPISAEAEIIEREGKLVVSTPKHDPISCFLSQLEELVGEFEIVGNMIDNPDLIKAV